MATTSAIADPPAAEIFISVNDGDPKTDTIVGAPSQNGNQVYIASYAALDGSWLVTYNVSADYTNNPQTALIGTVTVENKTVRDTLSFRVGLDVPICPMVERGSFVGGSALLTLATNGPGTLSCVKEGTPIFRGTTDGHPVGSIFYCPTTLSSTGSSLISYSGTYGLPGVSLPGKPSFETIGMVEEFRLTAKDKLTMQFTLFFKDANGIAPPVPCEMDVDGDGIVGPIDLAEIFASWGTTSFCPSMLPTDFNDDGQVDAADLMILLNAWGDCEG